MRDNNADKKLAEKAGRQLAMLFNRAVMYNMDHPFTAKTIDDFYNLLEGTLKTRESIVILMHREQFFSDDHPFDPRVNVSKMLAHFKKGEIDSLFFEQGITENELKDFLTVFMDTDRYQNTDAMKKAFADSNVTHVRVNHVFFKKMTEDDLVIDRSQQGAFTGEVAPAGVQGGGDTIVDLFTGGLTHSVDSLKSAIEDLFSRPDGMSGFLVPGDPLSLEEEGGEPGCNMVRYIKRIRQDVGGAAGDIGLEGIHALAQSVLKMKHDLLSGIDESRKRGRLYENEAEIRSEVDALSDQVLLRLVKEEYKCGRVSVERLAQILRRLVPETGELNRLLPKLKHHLMGEGMSLADFMRLTSLLDKELRSDEIADALNKSAEDMGISGETLIREIIVNPGDAAELIYLASEIRQGAGDSSVLSDLLVEYVEKVGSKISLGRVISQEGDGGESLRDILAGVNSEIVGKLQHKEISRDVMDTVVARLSERLDTCMGKLDLEWALYKTRSGDMPGSGGMATFLQLFEEGAEDGSELKQIMANVRAAFKEKGLDENNPRLIAEEIFHARAPREKGEVRHEELPKGVLSRNNMFYFVEREISRARRYQTCFSTIMLSPLKVGSPKNGVNGNLNHRDISNGVLSRLIQIVRDTDVVGMFDTKKVIVLLPMVGYEGAHFALRRYLMEIQTSGIVVKERLFALKLAGSVTVFNPEESMGFKAYVKKAENNLLEMVQRLKSIQALY